MQAWQQAAGGSPQAHPSTPSFVEWFLRLTWRSSVMSPWSELMTT